MINAVKRSLQLNHAETNGLSLAYWHCHVGGDLWWILLAERLGWKAFLLTFFAIFSSATGKVLFPLHSIGRMNIRN